MRKERRNIPLADILPNTGQAEWLPANPRQWTAQDINRTARSIKEDTDFLEERPILVFPLDDKFIAFAGNLRREGCIKNKMTTAPCVIHYPENEADQETIKRRAIKDNGTFGSWDFDQLANEWDDLPLNDWGVPAWETEERPAPDVTATEDDFNEDTDNVETRCKRGDVWVLGEHRLMCGDSTDANDVERLMNGEGADMVFTDPPYKIESGGGGESDIAKSLTAQKSDIDFISGFDPTDFLKILPAIFDNKINAYVFCNKDLLPQYLNWAVEQGYGFNVLIWKKPSAIPIKDAHRPDIEYLLFFRKKAIWNHSLEGVNYSRCLEYSREQRSEENGNHPTPKPINLICNELRISSNEGSIIVDLFGGSGSTLIACEQLSRKCYMMELDPHYCDVILARWEKLTGQTATKI